MTGLALYRLPYEQQVTMVAQTEGEPQELLSCEALNGLTGFVVAPFSISPDTPLILIHPDVVKTFKTVSDCFDGRNSLFPWEKQFVSIGETTVAKHTLQISNIFSGILRMAIIANWC